MTSEAEAAAAVAAQKKKASECFNINFIVTFRHNWCRVLCVNKRGRDYSDFWVMNPRWMGGRRTNGRREKRERMENAWWKVVKLFVFEDANKLKKPNFNSTRNSALLISCIKKLYITTRSMEKEERPLRSQMENHVWAICECVKIFCFFI